LWHRLLGGTRLEPSLALRFTLETLTGLIYARKVINGELGKAFIHRDIKPENLLIAGNGALKVSDFGLVMSGGGTWPYMAPEQWIGKEVEEKTDVYDLACVLYEMIKGKPPFTGKTKEEFRDKHINSAPGPIDGIPVALNGLILRCLDKSPLERLGFVDLRQSLQDVYSSISGRSFNAVDEPEPLSAEEFNARGSGFDELGYFEKALNCYDAAIALDPNDVRFYLNRANARLALKDYDGSWEDYKQALRLEPQAVEAYLGLGIMMVQKGENEKALRYYHQAEEVNSHEPMVYVGLGNLYAKNEKYSEAKTAFMKALSLRAGTAEAHLGLGNVSVCRQDYKNAEKCYQKAISLHPLYSQAYFSLARLYHWGNREEDMNNTLKKLREIEPG
jgi:tetratricopeptide (TPR) repeat protein